MQFRSFIVGILASSLLAAGVLGPTVLVSRQGDVNADGRVDVLDAQLLVAQVVQGSGHVALAKADTNRDGLVDVLDLQYTLARVNGAPTEDTSTPSDTKSLPVNTLRAWAGGCLFVLAVMVVRLGVRQPQFSRHTASPPRVLPCSIHRHLFTLTPHAPPSVS